MIETNYNPDVLTCLANLSNDEVFTPPNLANQMLDILPQELFTSSKTTFLDPVSKSGVFLREIAKRLMTGLQTEFPNQQDVLRYVLTANAPETKDNDFTYAYSHIFFGKGTPLIVSGGLTIAYVF